MADRYFAMGQIFITDGTSVINTTGRKVADTAFTCATSGTFTITMANGTTGTVTGTNIQGSPVTLVAGGNVITTTDAVPDGNIDITIGTAANWNSVNSWSATDGGAVGASVPTSSDNAKHGSNSYTAASQVLTVNTDAYFHDMDFTGATNTPTLAIGTYPLYVVGGTLTFILDMVTSGTGLIRPSGTSFITCNGLSIKPRLYLASGTLTLNDAFNNSTGAGGASELWITGGTLIPLGTVTTLQFLIEGSGAKTITLGSQTINCSSLSCTGSNLTITANTATINVSGVGAGTFGNANWNGVSFNFNGTAHTLSGSPTGINVLTRNGTATKTDSLTLTSGSTITCTTFAPKGQSATNRLIVVSSTLGTAATITATNWTGAQNVDLMDITATNAVDLSAITGNSGDCGGNTGITFTAGLQGGSAQATTGAGNFSGAIWPTRVPLPQDDWSSSNNITLDEPRIGRNVTFTGAPTITLGNSLANYGSVTFASGMTYTHNNNNWLFRSRSDFTLTSAGKLFNEFQFYNYGSICTLQDDIATKVVSSVHTEFRQYAGTIDLNGYTITAGYYYYTTGLARTLIFGSGTLILDIAGATVANKWSAANLTINAGTGTIVISNSDATGQTFAGGGLTYNNLTVQGAGAYALTITGNNTFNIITVDRSVANKTLALTGTTQTVTRMVMLKSGTNTITITGGTIASTERIRTDYLILSNSTITPAPGFAGKNSTNSGGNTGWVYRVNGGGNEVIDNWQRVHK